MPRKANELTYPELVKYLEKKLKEQDTKILAVDLKVTKLGRAVTQLWLKTFGSIVKKPE